jgi:hypothetical protein
MKTFGAICIVMGVGIILTTALTIFVTYADDFLYSFKAADAGVQVATAFIVGVILTGVGLFLSEI